MTYTSQASTNNQSWTSRWSNPTKFYFSFFDDIFSFNVIEFQVGLKISHFFHELHKLLKIIWNNDLKNILREIYVWEIISMVFSKTFCIFIFLSFKNMNM